MKIKIREYKNYKEMCEVNKLDVKTGKSKQLQMDEIERLYNFEKVGNKLIFKSKKRNPKEKVDNRKGNSGKSEGSRGNNNQFGKDFDDIIMYYMKNRIELDDTFNNIMHMFNIASQADIEMKRNEEFKTNKLKELIIRKWTYNNYTRVSRKIMKDQFNYALNRLAKSNNVEHYTHYVAITTSGKHIDIEKGFNSTIAEAMHKASEACEVKNRSVAMMIGGKVLKQFDKLVNDFLNDDMFFRLYVGEDIKGIYEKYYIKAITQKEVTDKRLQSALKDLYKRIITEVHKKLAKEKYKDTDNYLFTNDRARYEILTLDKILFANYDKDYSDEVTLIYNDFGDIVKPEPIREKKTTKVRLVNAKVKEYEEFDSLFGALYE